MQELVNQCLGLIIKDNVDEVVWAFRNTYFWYLNKKYPARQSDEAILKRFLDKMSKTLGGGEYKREQILEEEISGILLRNSKDIEKDIQQFLNALTKEEGIDFLGELFGAYALVVPEPLFRVARTYLGLHMTPNIPARDDKLPMTDDMILHAWQYDWFHTWLGE